MVASVLRRTCVPLRDPARMRSRVRWRSTLPSPPRHAGRVKSRYRATLASLINGRLELSPIVSAFTLSLLVWLVAGCTTARPTTLARTPSGYEVLSAQCPSVAESCSAIRVTGDPHDEEAWGFRARPGANSIWKESQVLYAVGNRMRCDEVRATLQTPSEGCWGPVYFRREGR